MQSTYQNTARFILYLNNDVNAFVTIVYVSFLDDRIKPFFSYMGRAKFATAVALSCYVIESMPTFSLHLNSLSFCVLGSFVSGLEAIEALFWR